MIAFIVCYFVAACIWLAIMAYLMFKSPEAYEDETGFHLGQKH
jgi:cytochrome bd-type quinol oxidase subunit 1